MIKRSIKRLLGLIGLSVTRAGRNSNAYALGYIPAKETIAAAESASLSIPDYVEQLWGIVGHARAVIDQLAAAGALPVRSGCVLEIGTGTGRYAGQVLARCAPGRYESYETAADWAEWLAREFPIHSMPADGRSLAGTPARSIDLAHAHGVFVYLPILVSIHYWEEVCRVVKPGGFAAFDLLSEACFSDDQIERWQRSGKLFPVSCCKGFVVAFFERRGFTLTTSFLRPYSSGVSEYLVFKRVGV